MTAFPHIESLSVETRRELAGKAHEPLSHEEIAELERLQQRLVQMDTIDFVNFVSEVKRRRDDARYGELTVPDVAGKDV